MVFVRIITVRYGDSGRVQPRVYFYAEAWRSSDGARRKIRTPAARGRRHSSVPSARERHIDRRRVRGGRDAVEANAFIVRPPVAADVDTAGRHNSAVLTHADNCVVASIGDVEVGALIERCVARPVDVVIVPLNRGKIDRQIQPRRADAVDRAEAEYLIRATPKLTRLRTAIEFWKGSLTNSCRTTGAVV
jgi:hypothetical protein